LHFLKSEQINGTYIKQELPNLTKFRQKHYLYNPGEWTSSRDPIAVKWETASYNHQPSQDKKGANRKTDIPTPVVLNPDHHN
jgi:hypothetical protein